MKFVHLPQLDLTIRLNDRNAMRRQQPHRLMSVPFDAMEKASPLPTPPATIDWSRGNTLQFPILGNDRFGDCFYCAAVHASQTFTGNAGVEDTFDANAVIQAYTRLSGGDNGLSADLMFGEWKRGLVGGQHKIIDDMAINPTDQSAMALGAYLFGGLIFTLGIPDAWLAGRGPGPGSVWDAGPGVQADRNNGHAVWFTGKNSQGYQVQTWGLNPPVVLTPAGVGVCDPAADVVFSLDWFDTAGVAPNGYSYDQLAAFWVQLGGHQLPPSPFVPGPVPPTPIPPGPTPPSPAPSPNVIAIVDAAFVALERQYANRPMTVNILRQVNAELDRYLRQHPQAAEFEMGNLFDPSG